MLLRLLVLAVLATMGKYNSFFKYCIVIDIELDLCYIYFSVKAYQNINIEQFEKRIFQNFVTTAFPP